jgi:glycoprotein endo-alpha-1,2-mannosidase
MRKEVVPRQYPSLGEYDDTDPQVIAEHMKMFRRANIGLLVTSWWGPNRLEDSTTKDVIMEHKDVGNLKIALLYETTNRLKNGLANITNAKTDIEYMCQHYFNHPNYYKVDGRPVIFIYLARTLENRGVLEESLLTMRSEAAKSGHNIYLIGDFVFGSSPINTEEEPFFPFWYFDAVTNYDVYGSAGRPAGHAGHEAVTLYYESQARWKEETAKENCTYIPAVSPGYNDRGVRLDSDHPALSRRLIEDAEEGSLFHFQLMHAKALADPQLEKLIMVNSFNEWHEDTQIEPVAIGDNALWPPVMTQDLEYVGYGNLYLDILGASTVSENGQGLFDHLYEI